MPSLADGNIVSLESGTPSAANGLYIETSVAGDLSLTTDSTVSIATIVAGVDFFWAITSSGLTAGLSIGYFRALTDNVLDFNVSTGTRSAFTPAVLYVGDNSYAAPFNGRIWDVKCWGRVLTERELLLQSYASYPLNEDALNFWWPLERHDLIRDFGPQRRDPTVTGTLTTEPLARLKRTRAKVVTLPFQPASGGTTTTKTMTDTLTLSDQELDSSIMVRQMNDTITVTDAVTRWTRLTRVLSDGIDLIDGVVKSVVTGGALVFTKVMTDTLIASDAFFDWLRRRRDQTDTIVISEDGLQRAFIMTASETLDVSDGVVQWLRLKRLAQDSIDVVDGFSKTLVGAGIVYAKVMSDTVTLIDDAGRRWSLRTSQLTDAIGLSDAVVRTVLRVRVLGDVIEFSDGTVKISRYKRVLADNLDLVDGFSKTLVGVGIVYAKVMSDTVTLIDDAGQRWKLRVSQLTDAVGLSDQVIRYLRAVRTLGDVVEFSDGTVKIRRTTRSMDESIEVGDEKISTLYLDQMSNVSFSFGSSGPPFRFGGT